MEGLREQAEGLAEVFDISLLLADARKTVYVFGVGQRLADCLVPTELRREVHAQPLQRRLPRERLVVLEGEVDHGVLPLVRHPLVGAVALRYRARLEEMPDVRLVRASLLEEALEHLHRGSLAEPARAREERDARVRRQQVAYEQRLVDAVVVRRNVLPVALANRKRQLPVAKVSRHLFHVVDYTIIWRGRFAASISLPTRKQPLRGASTRFRGHSEG